MDKNVIVVNKKILSKDNSIEVTGDIIVPDIKPDIVSIINTNGIGYIYKEDINNGRIRVDGNLDTYVVYLADNGETKSIQNTLTFSETMEDNNLKEGLYMKHEVSIENIEAKILNERKISVICKIKIKVEAFEREEVELSNTVEELENVEILKENCDIKSLIGVSQIKTSIKEDIKVDSSYKIAEILKTSLEVRNMENKVSYNKVLAKADADIKIIFLTEDNRVGIAEAEVPIMSFIDIANITDKDICNVSYSVRNMLFKVNTTDSNSINSQIDFNVSCEAYQIKNIEVVQDMYGIRKSIGFTKKDIQVELYKDENIQTINMNEKILIEDVLNILDVNSKATVVNINKIGNYFNYECEMKLEFYYEADNKNGLSTKNITIPFMAKFEGEEKNLKFKINKKQFTISGENVDCEIEIIAKQENSLVKHISIIDNIEVKELENENEYKMFMYFVKNGDSIWKIAKRFKVCSNDIIKLNNLENPDKLNIGDALYIMR